MIFLMYSSTENKVTLLLEEISSLFSFSHISFVDLRLPFRLSYSLRINVISLSKFKYIYEEAQLVFRGSIDSLGSKTTEVLSLKLH